MVIKQRSGIHNEKSKIQYLTMALVNTQSRVFKSLERKIQKYSKKGSNFGEETLSENPCSPKGKWVFHANLVGEWIHPTSVSIPFEAKQRNWKQGRVMQTLISSLKIFTKKNETLHLKGQRCTCKLFRRRVFHMRVRFSTEGEVLPNWWDSEQSEKRKRCGGEKNMSATCCVWANLSVA